MVSRLIEYNNKADVKLKELEDNEETHTVFYKKLKNYKIKNKKLYDNIMRRKMTWEPFGKATSEDNDAYTIHGDDVYMEMVNETKVKKEQPEYFKYYEGMGMTDQMIEDNYQRYISCMKKYKTTRELHTLPNGDSQYIYVTRPVEAEKYRKKFEVPKEAKVNSNKKRALDDLFKDSNNND